MKYTLLTLLALLLSICEVSVAYSQDISIPDAIQTLTVEFAKLEAASTKQPSLPILTADRINVLKRLQSDNHIYWQTVKAYADKTVAGNSIYDDLGQSAALVYVVTKDITYANAAWDQLQKVMANDGRAANDVRQRYIDYLLIFAWIKDSLTDAQILAFENTIKLWSDYCLGVNQPRYTGSFRLNDSDQTIGQFFGLALQDALKIPPGNLLNQNMINLNTGLIGKPIGGLASTAADDSTARNVINEYVSILAKGGEWPESSQYDLNTVMLLITGWVSSWDALGINYFPEISNWIPDACSAALVDWSPQLEQRILWGDNDTDVTGPNLYKALPYLAALQHAATKIGANNEAAHIGGLIDSLILKYPSAISAAEIHFFFYCNPYISTSAIRKPTLVQYNYSPGVGIYRRIDNNSLFFGYSPSRINIDHEFDLIGDFRLWNNGEYVISEPISYGGTGQANTSNSITVSGISSMLQQGYINSQTTQEYTYLEALTAGPLYDSTMSWNPPPTWCNELRRRIIYFPAGQVIFVCDRINSDDPLIARPDLSGYTNADAQRIKNSKHRHVIYWNCVTEPTVNINNNNNNTGLFTYTTPGNQQVQFTYFSATSNVLQITSYDEKTAWSDYGIPQNQLMYGVQVNPVVDQQWDCILWCIRLKPSSDAPKYSIQNNLAEVIVDGYTIYFSIDSANPYIDPNAQQNSSLKGYFVGCSGNFPVVKR